MHQRHPQTHNMKTEEDDGIVKAIRDGARPAWPSMNGCEIVWQGERGRLEIRRGVISII
jgi:hypothetical protein